MHERESFDEVKLRGLRAALSTETDRARCTELRHEIEFILVTLRVEKERGESE